MFFAPGGLPFGFAVTDFPIGVPVSGSFVSTLVPLRDDDLPLWGGVGHDIGEELPRFGLFEDEATEIGEESATEMGETPSVDLGLLGLSEMKGDVGTRTFTPSEEEPALPATGIDDTGGSANCGDSSTCFSNSRIKDEDVSDEGEPEQLPAILNTCCAPRPIVEKLFDKKSKGFPIRISRNSKPS